MATKTYRSIYMPRELEKRLVKIAEAEQSSVSRLVRLGVEKFLTEKFGEKNNQNSEIVESA